MRVCACARRDSVVCAGEERVMPCQRGEGCCDVVVGFVLVLKDGGGGRVTW